MTDLYRENVAMIVRNKDGLILVGERRDIPGNWQLPQGGLDAGESHEEALWRELREESGLEKESCRLVGQSGSFSYKFPEHAAGWRGFVGQRQVYFLLDVIDDGAVPLLSDEFVSWAWVSLQEVHFRVVDFKKPVYEKAFTYFFGEAWNGN